MTDTHYELMAKLQSQRDQLARFVWIFAPPEYATLRTEAVDRLVLTHDIIQLAIAYPGAADKDALYWRTWHNNRLIETFNAALIAMPQPVYEAVDAGL